MGRPSEPKARVRTDDGMMTIPAGGRRYERIRKRSRDMEDGTLGHLIREKASDLDKRDFNA